MRYVMVTYPSSGHRDWWAAATAAEKRAHIDEIRAWFSTHRALGRIDGGEELGDPTYVKSIRKGSVIDGPFIETKEAIGGFIVLEVPDEATAIEVASGWPSLRWDGDVVELRLAGDSVAEAAVQAADEASGG
ncbi:MAG TPA: YciI family protein [Candidatus Limnocylindrales bacterium]|nr:YciI family protein [Candidatus Limnocylindrales bacterium]